MGHIPHERTATRDRLSFQDTKKAYQEVSLLTELVIINNEGVDTNRACTLSATSIGYFYNIFIN